MYWLTAGKRAFEGSDYVIACGSPKRLFRKLSRTNNQQQQQIKGWGAPLEGVTYFNFFLPKTDNPS